jgi:pimeloyl-ACP methyl ester carboxylesterase
MPPDRLAIVVEETCKVPSHVWRSAFAGFLGTEDFTGELRRIAVPTLLVWGDRDGYATREAQDRLMAAIPGARLVVYEGGGHAVHWEEPERFARDLETWIDGIPVGTAGVHQDPAGRPSPA